MHQLTIKRAKPLRNIILMYAFMFSSYSPFAR